MKHPLITTIAAVVLVGCGESQQSAPPAEAKPAEAVAEAAKPELPTAKVPYISIHFATAEGNIKAVTRHLANGVDVNVKNDFGFTPLLKAAQFGRREVAELLIAKGADVSVKDKFGRTPLHCAADEGQMEVAELLIAAGADVNGKDNGGRTPLDFTVMTKQNEIADLLRKHGGKTGEELKAEESIHDAARYGNIEAVQQHLDAGVDVNAK
ncbi:MAG: ankyrin repeat domain-containing protein, partial [Nitrospinaceae bacterium]|nr:ankyrin repeat domain-containing protein [Nitrospinaceae bacterium]